MSRKRIGARGGRGRPRQLHAKRRCTTRQGRQTGQDPVDTGTPQLVQLKRIAANGSGQPVELTDAAGILAAHHALDNEQLMTIRLIANWLDQVHRGRGASLAGVGALWTALLSGQRGGRVVTPVIDAGRRTPADQAWWRLCGLFNFLGSPHDLFKTAR